MALGRVGPGRCGYCPFQSLSCQGLPHLLSKPVFLDLTPGTALQGGLDPFRWTEGGRFRPRPLLSLQDLRLEGCLSAEGL